MHSSSAILWDTAETSRVAFGSHRHPWGCPVLTFPACSSVPLEKDGRQRLSGGLRHPAIAGHCTEGPRQSLSRQEQVQPVGVAVQGQM